MRNEEIHFIVIGCLLAVGIGFVVAKYNQRQGYTFGKHFLYASIILSGLVFVLWQWIYHGKI